MTICILSLYLTWNTFVPKRSFLPNIAFFANDFSNSSCAVKIRCEFFRILTPKSQRRINRNTFIPSQHFQTKFTAIKRNCTTDVCKESKRIYLTYNVLNLELTFAIHQIRILIPVSILLTKK